MDASEANEGLKKTGRTERFVSRLTQNTLAVILAGGRGSRLKHLTLWRAKPAVHFAGKFRIIDFPLSNCVNSGIRRIAVLTQYKAHSLIRHIQQGWNFLRGELGEYVEIVPAQQRIETSWYAGTADAVFQNLDIIYAHAPEYVLILAADHIYKMDYGPMIAYHVAKRADLTVGCFEAPLDRAREFGVMTVDDDQRVVRFDEKPVQPQPMPGSRDKALVSMGIYIVNARFLYEQLIKDADIPSSSHDFGKDIIPAIIDKYRVIAYPFRDATGATAYWRDVGTVDAFWEANLELIGVTPELNLYDEDWPIWTYQPQLPPAKFVFDDEDRRGMAVDSMVSGGCIIAGGQVFHSLLFSNVYVRARAYLKDCVVMPDVEIGEDCRLTKVILERGCRVPDGTVIGQDPAEDAKKYYVTPRGVALVIPEMLGERRFTVR